MSYVMGHPNLVARDLPLNVRVFLERLEDILGRFGHGIVANDHLAAKEKSNRISKNVRDP